MASNNKKHKRKPRRKTELVALMILLIILIIFAALAVFVSKRFAPSKEQTDLRSYYNLTADESNEIAEAASDELAIVLEDDILETRAIREGDDIFVPYKLVYENIDNRFYVDIIEDVLIYTTATEKIASEIESSSYSINGTEQDAGYKVATYRGNTLYVNLKFVDQYSSVHYEVFDEPERVCIWYQTGTFNYCTAKQALYMRVKGGIKSDIVTKIESGAKLKVIEDLEDWLEVIDERGYRGYVQTKFVSDAVAETVESDYTEPEYTHIDFGETINMVWDQIQYDENNYELEYRTTDVTGINAISPTWFMLGDEYGTISSLASSDYVTYAHEQGWKVLPLINNGNGIEYSEVFARSSRRSTAIEQIISIIKEVGADGINVDFEEVPSESGDDYIQFLRELSIRCREENLLFTIDDYAPYKFNSHYQISEQSRIADYVIVMAYDDYVGEDQAGPNAGLPFEEEVLDMCKEQVDMSRLVVGIPFYTRVWYEYTDGTLGNDSYSMSGANDIISQRGLTPNWIEDIGYEYSTYDDWDKTVKIWFENAKSIEAKLELISEYNVAGTSAWALTQETSDIWEVIAKYNK